MASNPNVLDFPFYWYTRLLCFHSEKSLLVEQQLVVTYFSVLFSWSCWIECQNPFDLWTCYFSVQQNISAWLCILMKGYSILLKGAATPCADVILTSLCLLGIQIAWKNVMLNYLGWWGFFCCIFLFQFEMIELLTLIFWSPSLRSIFQSATTVWPPCTGSSPVCQTWGWLTRTQRKLLRSNQICCGTLETILCHWNLFQG